MQSRAEKIVQEDLGFFRVFRFGTNEVFYVGRVEHYGLSTVYQAGQRGKADPVKIGILFLDQRDSPEPLHQVGGPAVGKGIQGVVIGCSQKITVEQPLCLHVQDRIGEQLRCTSLFGKTKNTLIIFDHGALGLHISVFLPDGTVAPNIHHLSQHPGVLTAYVQGRCIRVSLFDAIEVGNEFVVCFGRCQIQFFINVLVV